MTVELPSKLGLPFMSRVCALIFLLIAFSANAAVPDPILEGMLPGTITFIGESHKHAESPKLVRDLVSAHVKQGHCLIVALEIADDEQPAIDRVLAGASASTIDIPVSIDHLAMRKLIEHLAVLTTQSACLSVVAIDAGPNNPGDRDEWMAERLADLVGDRPILVLIGALHTLQKVNWLSKSGKPSVAEKLATKGFQVRSFPQRWLSEKCNKEEHRHQRFVNADSKEALTILNESLMSLINARPHQSARGVVDGFVIWECDNPSRQNA
jgi:hypothetical protein